MAKAGNKLMKLRSALKKMNSFSKLRREETTNNPIPIIQPHDCNVEHTNVLHTVYVGKSLRPYQVSHQVLDHPVIQELVSKSDGCDGAIVTVIKCEVVLFEHLLWMLQNSDAQSEPLDDLVGFYAY